MKKVTITALWLCIWISDSFAWHPFFFNGDEGAESSGALVATLRNDQQSGTYFYETVDVTAESGKDYEATSGSIELAVREEGAISIPILDDGVFEGNEFFKIRITHTSPSWLIDRMMTTEVPMIIDGIEISGSGIKDSFSDSGMNEHSLLNSIAFGNQRFVIATNAGTVLISEDGDDWTVHEIEDLVLRNLTWEGDRFLANGSPSRVYESLDGIQWNTVSRAGSQVTVEAIWTGERYVSFQAYGSADYSTSIASSTGVHVASNIVDATSFGNGVVVAISNRSIHRSADHGETWAAMYDTEIDEISFQVVENNGERIVVLGTIGKLEKGIALYSDDQGLTWNFVENSPDVLNRSFLRRLVWLEDHFMGVGDQGVMISSLDGLEWELIDSSPSENLFGIAVGNGRKIAVGEKGSIRILEPNGRWVSRFSGSSPRFNGVFDFGLNRYAVGDNGVLAISTNEEAWELNTIEPGEHLMAGVSNLEIAVIVGAYGNILTSIDGLNWELTETPTNYWLRDITWTGERFIAVGYGGIILSSTDGRAWIRRSEGGERLYAVHWTGSEVLAVGDKSTVWRSEEGILWEELTLDSEVDLRGVASNPDREWVLVGKNGQVLRSENNENWQEFSASELDFEDVVWTGNVFAAVGRGGSLWTSPHGIIWGRESFETERRLYSIEVIDEELIVAGSEGAIFERGLVELVENFPQVWLEAVSVNEDDGLVNLNVMISDPVAWWVTGSYGLSGYTADVGRDVRMFDENSRKFAIPPGETNTTIQLFIQDDLFHESDEVFYCGIEKVINGCLKSNPVAVTIFDDERDSNVQILETLSEIVVRERQYTANIKIEATAPLETRASISYQTRNGSASSEEDYLPVKGSLVFEQGDTEGWITIPLQANDGIEGEEAFFIDFGDAVNVELQGTDSVKVRIACQDRAISVRAPEESLEYRDSHVRFFIENRSGRDVLVDYTTEDGSAVAGEDFESVSGTVTVPASGLWIDVPLIDDGKVEKLESFGLKIATSSEVPVDIDFASARISSDDVDSLGRGAGYSNRFSNGKAIWTGDRFLMHHRLGMISSLDGENWEFVNAGLRETGPAHFQRGEGVIVSIGPSRASRDGISWREILPCDNPNDGWNQCPVPIEVRWSGRDFLVRCSLPGSNGAMAFGHSHNGFDWGIAALNVSQNIGHPVSLTWSGTRWIYNSYQKLPNRKADLYWSRDGIHWPKIDSVRSPVGQGMYWLGDRLTFQRFSDIATNTLEVSTNVWDSGEVRTDYWKGLEDVHIYFSDAIYNGVEWIAPGGQGGVFVSENGIDWGFREGTFEGPLSFQPSLNHLAWNGEKYLSQFYEGYLVSSDARHWKYVRLDSPRSRLLVVNERVFTATSVYSNEWEEWTGDMSSTIDGTEVNQLGDPDGILWNGVDYRIDRRDSNRNKIVSGAEDIDLHYTHAYRQSLYSLAVFNDRIFALGEGQGYNRRVLLSSSGGAEWQSGEVFIEGYWNTLTSGNGYLIMSDRGKHIAVSSDAVDWLSVTLDIEGDIRYIRFDNGTFVIVTSKGVILSSLNGTDWDQHKMPAEDVQWTGNQWVSIMADGALYRSENLDDWEIIAGGGFGVQLDESARFWVGSDTSLVGERPDVELNMVVPEAVYEGQELKVKLLLSEVNLKPVGLKLFLKGNNYNEQIAIFEQYIEIAAGETESIISIPMADNHQYFPRQFVFVELMEVGNAVASMTSQPIRVIDDDANAQGYFDPVHIGLPTNEDLFGVCFENSIGVVVGDNGIVLRSIDKGETWESVDAGVGEFDLSSVTWAGDRFVMVGQGGRIFTSPSGIQWTRQNGGTTRYLYDAYWSGSRLVVVGSDVLMTTEDFVEWNVRESGAKEVLPDIDRVIWKGVAGNSEGLLVVGEHGLMTRSTDGVAWSAYQPVGVNQEFFQTIHWDGKQYYAGGLDDGNQPLLSSFDGIEWQSHHADSVVRGIAHNEWNVTAVGTAATFMKSYQQGGHFWNIRYYDDDSRLNNVAWSGKYFVYVGANGFISYQRTFEGPMGDWDRWLSRYQSSSDENIDHSHPKGSLMAINNSQQIPNLIMYALGYNPFYSRLDRSIISVEKEDNGKTLIQFSSTEQLGSLAEVEIQRTSDFGVWETIAMWDGNQWIGNAIVGRLGSRTTVRDESASGSRCFYRMVTRLKEQD